MKSSPSRKRSSGGARGTAWSDPNRAEGDPRHQLERYEIIEVRRDQIKNAEYNPRVISEKARLKLQEGLRKLGLLHPLIWNKKTGNLVGGHQRLKILDNLSEGKPYTLRVSAVELTEAEEREANILLNNPEAMGQWDLGKLDETLRYEGVRLEATGFDMSDMYNVLGDSPFVEQNSGHLEEMVDRLGKVAGQISDGLKTIHKDRENVDFYIVLVFKNDDDCGQFIDTLGLDNKTFHDGRVFWKMLKAKQAGVSPEEVTEDFDDAEASFEASDEHDMETTQQETDENDGRQAQEQTQEQGEGTPRGPDDADQDDQDEADDDEADDDEADAEESDSEEDGQGQTSPGSAP